MFYGHSSRARIYLGLKIVDNCTQNFKKCFCVNVDGTRTENFFSNLQTRPEEIRNEEMKIVNVAVIGAPNAGKSSLINQLMGRMVCPVSRKVHTTRCRARAVATEENTQMIFLDTPGLVTSNEVQRFHLENSFLQDGELALMEADLLGVVHDVSNAWTSESLDTKVLRLLELYPDKSSFLILNKVDLVKNKRTLLDLVNVLTNQTMAKCTRPKKSKQLSETTVKNIIKDKSGWENFSEVFMVSALAGDGVDKIMDYLLKSAKPGKWLHDPSYISDVSPQKLISQTVKAKLLEHLPHEVPYNLKTTVEYLDNSNSDLITAVVGVYCPTARIERLVVGSKGGRIKIVARAAEMDLRNAFHRSIHLKIAVSNMKK